MTKCGASTRENVSSKLRTHVRETYHLSMEGSSGAGAEAGGSLDTISAATCEGEHKGQTTIRIMCDGINTAPNNFHECTSVQSYKCSWRNGEDRPCVIVGQGEPQTLALDQHESRIDMTIFFTRTAVKYACHDKSP